jgi:hypothetical protein
MLSNNHMKKLLILLVAASFFACGGNENADIKTNDQDHTAKDSPITKPLVQKDTTGRDSTNKKDQ